MAELKTKKNDASVEDFIKGVENEKKRTDSFAIISLMQEVTGEEPAMWGDSIVGFGPTLTNMPAGVQENGC